MARYAGFIGYEVDEYEDPNDPGVWIPKKMIRRFLMSVSTKLPALFRTAVTVITKLPILRRFPMVQRSDTNTLTLRKQKV